MSFSPLKKLRKEGALIVKVPNRKSVWRSPQRYIQVTTFDTEVLDYPATDRTFGQQRKNWERGRNRKLPLANEVTLVYFHVSSCLCARFNCTCALRILTAKWRHRLQLNGLCSTGKTLVCFWANAVHVKVVTESWNNALTAGQDGLLLLFYKGKYLATFFFTCCPTRDEHEDTQVSTKYGIANSVTRSLTRQLDKVHRAGEVMAAEWQFCWECIEVWTFCIILFWNAKSLC